VYIHLPKTVADIFNQSSILNASLSSTPGGSTANVFGPYESTPRRPAVDKDLHNEIENVIHDAASGDTSTITSAQKAASMAEVPKTTSVSVCNLCTAIALCND
jgi:hypothetical protein